MGGGDVWCSGVCRELFGAEGCGYFNLNFYRRCSIFRRWKKWRSRPVPSRQAAGAPVQTNDLTGRGRMRKHDPVSNHMMRVCFVSCLRPQLRLYPPSSQVCSPRMNFPARETFPTLSIVPSVSPLRLKCRFTVTCSSARIQTLSSERCTLPLSLA